MTDKEKIKDIKKLADAMYYAAQYLTTDASRLHRAMDEYHKFIIHEWREEPVSDDTMTIRKEWFEHCKKSWYNEGYIDGKHNRDGQFGEPVSEDLKTELNKYIKDHFTVDKEQLDRFGIEEKDYMYSMDKSDMLALVEHFTNWQKTKEEIACEELEDAAIKYAQDKYMPVQTSQAFKAGAEWQKTKDESTTEDLGEYINELSKQFPEVSFAKLSRIAVRVAKWQKEQFEKDYTDLCNGIATAKGIAVAMAYDKGMADAREQMMKNIWKPADGDDLPEIDREVVVFTQNFPNDAGIMSVSIAHRPNPNGWDGKSVTTGKVEHYTPKTYDKGGWNIPNVKWWLDCLIPNMEE